MGDPPIFRGKVPTLDLSQINIPQFRHNTIRSRSRSSPSFTHTTMEDDSTNLTSGTDIETNPLTSPSRRRSVNRIDWPTIDGPLGLSLENSLPYARRFFKLGFLCLPLLWAVNCFYFWPVLRKPQFRHSNPQLHLYIVGSAIGFLLFATILSSWALTFAIGGKHLFGNLWDELVMYNVAEKYGLTGWM